MEESKKGKYEDKEIQHSTQVSSSGGQDSSGGGVSECFTEFLVILY